MTRPAENQGVAKLQQTVEGEIMLCRDPESRRAGKECGECHTCLARAALRDLVARAARQEHALERIIEYRQCIRFDITPCDQRAELEEVEWCPVCVYRAARLDGVAAGKEPE